MPLTRSFTVVIALRGILILNEAGPEIFFQNQSLIIPSGSLSVSSLSRLLLAARAGIKVFYRLKKAFCRKSQWPVQKSGTTAPGDFMSREMKKDSILQFGSTPLKSANLFQRRDKLPHEFQIDWPDVRNTSRISDISLAKFWKTICLTGRLFVLYDWLVK